jgi:lipopolysaccharide biosynthesis regulator YciM
MEFLDKGEQEKLLHRSSHFYCERAEMSIQSKDYLSARRQIKRAESTAPGAIRPLILMASLELQLNHPEKARAIIERAISRISVELIEEALKLLKQACNQLEHPEAYIEAIESLYRSSGSGHVLSLLARELIATDQKARLHQILIDVPPADLGNLPLAVIAQWDDALIASLGSGGRLQSLSESTLSEEHYQCFHCGLELREYMWQCPGCRRWETLRTRNQIHV